MNCPISQIFAALLTITPVQLPDTAATFSVSPMDVPAHTQVYNGPMQQSSVTDGKLQVAQAPTTTAVN